MMRSRLDQVLVAAAIAGVVAGSWAVIIGAAVAVFAPNGFPGVLVMVSGGLVVAGCVEWLYVTGGHR